MGRDIVLKKIKSHGLLMIIFGSPIAMISILIALMFFIMGDGLEILAVLFLLLFLLGLLLLVMGIRCVISPEKSLYIKNNPDLLIQADQLYSNIIYEDKYIIVSDKVIANRKKILQMAYLEDIYLIYQHTMSMNFIRYTNELVLENRNKKNNMTINVYAKGKKAREDLFQLLSQVCPNARFGWTSDGLAYLNKMREKNISKF